MYEQTELALLYFPQEVQPVDEFFCSQRPDTVSGTPGSVMQPSTISDYNLGGEGDLFKAPEPVIQEAVMGIDPMTVAISMMSCGENSITPQSLSVEDIESSIESGQLLSEVFYECRKDLLAKEGNELPPSEVYDIKIPDVKTDENSNANGKLFSESQFQKCAGYNCPTSAECMHEAPMRPNFLDFSVMDLSTFYGMRRSLSEGDIKTLDNGNISCTQSPVERPTAMITYPSEDRLEKLSRYWSKKSKRNFGRKIKYACRKALADNQPRIRGRFAKTEESESLKKH